MLAINGVVFMIPSKLWEIFEQGHIASFCGKGTNSGNVAAKLSGAKATAQKYASYFHSCMGKQMNYFYQYVLMEILCVIVVISNMQANHIFFRRKYWTYGADVIDYWSISDHNERRHVVEPQCNIFPTTVSYLVLQKSNFVSNPVVFLQIICFYTMADQCAFK